MALLCGAWDVVVVEVDASGSELELARGEGRLESILDGRFVRWDATIQIAGAPRSTTGFLGFDVRSREYELLMISNLATGMSVASGRGDIERGGVRFTLEQVDPESGVRIRAVSLLRVPARDHFVLDQISADAGGGERVVRRQHYRRKLAPAAVTAPPTGG